MDWTEMASQVCPEDVVVLVSDPSTPGMVCCVGEDNNPGGLPTAHVYWLREKDNDKMEPISELRVLDRALLHGDTVLHNTRKGLVTGTRILVDMRYPDGTIVQSVDTSALKHLQPFRQSNWVVAEFWLGRVLSCRDDVVVQFDDGSQCLVRATDHAELQPVQKMYERSPFFPSMVVKAVNADTFPNAEWIRGSYNKQEQGIITSTRPAEVLVAWIAALQGSSSQPPSTTCTPETLSLLNHYGHTWWRLGDRTIYVRDHADEQGGHDDMQWCCEIIRTQTIVNIKYLDGTIALDIPATDTVLFNPGPHEFYPGDLVCDKVSAEYAKPHSSGISVVVSADARRRMAVIRQVQDSLVEPEETTCSVFDLQAHPDFSFRIGDVVLRLDAGAEHKHTSTYTYTRIGFAAVGMSMNLDDDNVILKEHDEEGTEDDDGEFGMGLGNEEAEGLSAVGEEGASGESDFAQEAHGSSFMMRGDNAAAGVGIVGEVMDIEKTGYVLVAWLGGQVTRVHPEEIYRVAIEDEMEDALFYRDGGEDTYDSLSSVSTTLMGNALESGPQTAALSIPIVNEIIGLPASSVMLATSSFLSQVSVALSAIPVLGSMLGWSSNVGRMMFERIAGSIILRKLLPIQMQAVPVGTSATSPLQSVLAVALGLGRFFGFAIRPVSATSRATDSKIDEGVDGKGAAVNDDAKAAGHALTPGESVRECVNDSEQEKPFISVPPPNTPAPPADGPVGTGLHPSSITSASVCQGSRVDEGDVHFRMIQHDSWGEVEGSEGVLCADGDRRVGSMKLPGGKGTGASTLSDTESGGTKEEDSRMTSASGDGGCGQEEFFCSRGSQGTVGLLQEPAGPVEFEKVQIIDDEKAWEGHHYASRTETPRNAGKFMSRVQKEWNLLRSSLPPDIYMVVYEDRCDLLQALIKGPQDSPYADGLFFFDIQLPSEYPDIPPRVYYHSHGDRLNPNLYENGKVCLSLLGTWAGTSVESWDPHKSNLLQVLVSIQGLILVPEPYYNEPSCEQYRGTAEGLSASNQYNEGAMLLTLQSIMITQPPTYFAKLAESHYRETRHRLLERCRQRLDQAKSQESDDGASLGFALSLERLLPRLEILLYKFGT